jgi:peptidoglycan/LPS O-acetylase OafA/YrhL
MRARTEIRPLTSLRAVLALWVLLRHMFVVDPVPVASDPGFLSNLLSHGYLGVDGFFILSGFILAYNYKADFALPRSNTYWNFLVARVARIYPVHLTTLLLVAALVVIPAMLKPPGRLGTPTYAADAFFYNVLLVQAWYVAPSTTWNDVAWSVSAEWFAYLCFPLFLRLADRARAELGTMLGLLPAFALLACIEAGSGNHLSLPGGLIRLVPEFYAGILLHDLYREARTRGWRFRWGGVAALALIAAGVAAGADTAVVLALAVLVVALGDESDLLVRPLGFEPFVYLGRISYCIYMVQRIVQLHWAYLCKTVSVLRDSGFAVQQGLFLALVLLAAAALHHAVEEPMRTRCAAWLRAQRQVPQRK